MNFLCWDTSSIFSAVCLIKNNRLVYGERRKHDKGRGDEFFRLVRHVLQKTHTSLSDVGAFGVGVGPGSFTGLRVGLSAAKGFSFAQHKPCYPFLSLDVIAANAPTSACERLSVALDARRSNVYTRAYKRNKAGELVPLKKEALLSAGEWLASCVRPGTVVAGDAVSLYRRELEARAPDAVSFLEEKLWYPTPESIARLTLDAYRLGRSTDAHGLKAVYLYARDCQIKKAC